MKPITTWDSFAALDIRVGTIIHVQPFTEARKAAYKLRIDFGSEIGMLRSSAQLKDNYFLNDLLGKQVLAVVNLGSKQMGHFISQCLVLGVYAAHGVVLVAPCQPVENGCPLG